ncbi:uncharacterized protein METZ01_LOCUS384605, partial [marine metagenome]
MSRRATYQRIARWYDLLDAPFERKRYQPIRPLLFADLSGRVLDAGVGTGRNIPFYPQDGDMLGIDLSPAMLTRASRRCDEAGRDVALMEMDVMHTSFEDNSFDAVVSTFL